MENTLSMFKKVCGMLTEMGFDLTILDSVHVVRLDLRDYGDTVDVGFHVLDEPSLLQAMICVPMVVPEKSRTKVAELIVRANCGWLIGHLGLDVSTGFLYWLASMPIEDGDITKGQFRRFLAAGVAMIRRYFPAINRLICSNDLSPAEAVAEIQMAAS